MPSDPPVGLVSEVNHGNAKNGLELFSYFWAYHHHPTGIRGYHCLNHGIRPPHRFRHEGGNRGALETIRLAGGFPNSSL